MAGYRPRLRRGMLNRVFGGVCGGIGELLGISAWWVRGVFVALAFTSFGFAALLYLLLWVGIPGQRIADVPPLYRPDEPAPLVKPRPEGILIVGVLAVVVGLVSLTEQTGILSEGRVLIAPGLLLLTGLVVMLKQLRGVA